MRQQCGASKDDIPGRGGARGLPGRGPSVWRRRPSGLGSRSKKFLAHRLVEPASAHSSVLLRISTLLTNSNRREAFSRFRSRSSGARMRRFSPGAVGCEEVLELKVSTREERRVRRRERQHGAASRPLDGCGDPRARQIANPHLSTTRAGHDLVASRCATRRPRPARPRLGSKPADIAPLSRSLPGGRLCSWKTAARHRAPRPMGSRNRRHDRRPSRRRAGLR
jgi:hypothetical protein